MAKPPDFSAKTIRLLSERSAMICNNPGCLTVTVGPYDAGGDMILKLGEAAHIRAARSGEARFDDKMTDVQRADFTNGIWLCRHCHEKIDKHGVASTFTRSDIESWKKAHEEMISVLIRSHRSPIAYLRKITDEGRLAQAIVDIADQHGALFADMALEDPNHVIQSVKALRKKFSPMVKEIQLDNSLKEILQRIITSLRELMNHSSKYPGTVMSELQTLRNRVGVQLKELRDSYGCKIPPHLTRIVPN